MKDLVEREGLFYKKFTDVPFTGEEQKEFENGEKKDPHVSYHDNGQLLEKGTRKNGKEDGPWVGFLQDGTVNEKLTGTFKNGVKVK